MSDVLRKALRPATVRLKLKSNAKGQLIGELLSLLDRAGLLKDRGLAERDVLQREGELSTGIADGVALPHARTDAVTELAVAIGLKPDGMDFESLDGNPSRIFVLSLLPRNATDEHLAFMSAISRRLQHGDVRKRLLESGTPADVVELLVSSPET